VENRLQFQTALRDTNEQLAEELASHLNKKRRERWDEAVTSIEFTHSSRKAWSFFNCLTGRISQPKLIPITANKIASRLVDCGRYRNHNRQYSYEVRKTIKETINSPPAHVELCGKITPTECKDVITNLKPGKAPDPDNIYPEFLLNMGSKITLSKFFSICLKQCHMPKLWRKANVIAVLKPGRRTNEAKSYTARYPLFVYLSNYSRE